MTTIKNLATCLVVAIGCSGTPEATAPPPRPRPAESAVQVFGSLRSIMHGGQLGAVTSLRDAAVGPHSYALGALADLRGEITVVAGQRYLAYAEGAGARVAKGPELDADAVLLVAANVQRWETVPIDRDTPLGDLGALVEAGARGRGLDPDDRIPFLIEGPLRDVDWHVVDGTRLDAKGGHQAHRDASVTGRLSCENCTLVGFYSRNDAGVFTHMGESVHTHVVTPAPVVSGHVDAAIIAAGSRLLLPAATGDSRSRD